MQKSLKSICRTERTKSKVNRVESKLKRLWLQNGSKPFAFVNKRAKIYNYEFSATKQKGGVMELTITDEKTKELLTEVLVEMMQQKREVFHEIVLEALEDVGLANAIAEGRQSEFVGEDEIMNALKG